MATRIKLRRDTATRWQNINPVLSLGEPGVETDTGKMKIGDGAKTWNTLDYFAGDATGGAADRLVNGDKEVILSEEGFTTFPTFQTGTESLFVQGAEIGSTNSGIAISANNQVILTADVLGNPKHWEFGTDGSITFPDSTVQTTAYVENNIDQHVWINEVSTSETGATPPDRIGAISSVEYDSQNNIIALAVHVVDGGGEGYSTISKFTPLGNIAWQLRFQGNQYTDGWGVAVGSDDSVYIVGTQGTNEYSGEVFITKIHTNGEPVWSKSIDFDGYSASSFVIDVAPDDGNLVLTGYFFVGNDASNETFTAKLNSDTGAVIWIKSLEGIGDESAFGLGVGADGSIVTVGEVDIKEDEVYNTADALASYTSVDELWTEPATGVVLSGITFDVTFAPGGNPTFTNIVDSVGSRHNNDIIGTIDKSLISTDPLANDLIVRIGSVTQLQLTKMLVTKYNTAGLLQWQKAVEYDEGFAAVGADADIDSDGNIYVCAQYDMTPTGGGVGTAIAITKFNASGVAQWTRRLNGDCASFASSIVVGPDDHLYISAMSGNEATDDFSMVVAKYEKNGQVAWQRMIDNTSTWTMTGSWWGFGNGSGSSIAIRDGYFAIGGTIADPFGTPTKGVLIQFPTDGEQLEMGSYLYTQSNLAGLLTSPYRVIADINKDDVDISGLISVSDFEYIIDSSILTVNQITLQGSASMLTSPSGEYHLRVTDDGSIVLPDGSEQTSAFVDAPSGPLPGFLRFKSRSPDKLVNQYFGWSGSGLWFNGDANDSGGASYPVYTSFTIPGDRKTIVTVDFVYNDGCSDPSICFFTDGVVPEWNWGSNLTRIAASYNCPTPHIYGLTTSATNDVNIVLPNHTYTARFTYDPTVGSDNLKLETLNSMGEIIDTVYLTATLPNQPYRVGFAADQDNQGGSGGEGNIDSPKTYFKNLTIDVVGYGTDSDSLQGYDSTGYVVNELKLGYAENTGWNWNYQLNGPTLKLSGMQDSDNLQPEQVIITGPAPTETYPNAQRLIIQGQRGYGEYGQGSAGEGGDVYIWGGTGGENDTHGAGGGDVKLRGGQGQIDGAGGYVRIEGGRNEFGTGEGGFVEVTGGYTNGNGAGGDVTISGGGSNGSQGRVMIRSGNNSKNWLFDPTGTLIVPGDIRKATDLSIAVGTHPLLENVTVHAADTFGAGIWRMFFLFGSYPNLLRDVTVGATVTTSWGTPVTATVQSITQDINVGYWILTFNQDISTGFASGNTVTFGPGCKTWTFGDDGNLTIPATGDIVRDGTSIFASSTALPVVTITDANFNQRDNPLPPATSTSEGAVVFTVTSPVALTATGLLLISGSNDKGGTIVTGGTTTGSQTLAFDMGGLNSTFTVVAFATTANGTSYSAPAGGHGGYVCFPAGTMITLSNGTKKAIEDIIYSDDLLVWDFDQGAYASAKPIWIKASETASEYNLLTFSDGSVLKTVGNHHIFNKHAERFTHTMTADTPIGTVSFNEYGEEISLVSAEVVKETVEFYNVWTEYHLNMFAEGVLTSNRFNNTYPIVGMKFAKGNKELRPMTEFNGLDPKWIHGLRLQEQTAEHTAEYIKWYVSERLEKLSIDSTQLAG